MHGIDPTTVESTTAPAEGFTAPDGSDALRLIDGDAAQILSRFADEVAPTVVTTTVAAGPTSDAAAAAPQMTTTASVTEPVSTERPLVSACVN